MALGWFPEQGVSVLSYVAGFILIMGVLVLAGEIVTKVIDATPLSIINHLGGGALGLLLVLLFTSLSLNLLDLVDRSGVFISQETKVESRFYEPIRQIVPTIYPHNLFSLGE